MAKLSFKTLTGKTLRLDENDEIHRGGEGRILSIAENPNLVAKIYHDQISPISEEQFQFLTKLDKNLFVTPQDLLLDTKTKKICGFTMEYIGKDFFPLSSLFIKSFCQRTQMNEIVKQKIAESLIAVVKIAHENKMVIGDFNQYNILVNAQGEIKCIDIDSYQTPQHQHSGILLDDIRDYFYGGKVCENSDFFALSILIFSIFTYVHPFKGIHKIYKQLSERMIIRLPIFANSPDMIVPKCYEPLNNADLQQQFSRFYLQGHRFLLSLEKQIIPTTQKIATTILPQKDLIINEIMKKEKIQNIYFLQNIGYIETDKNFVVYKIFGKGNFSVLETFSKSEFSKIYLSAKNILLRKENKLFHYKSKTEIVELTNFIFPNEFLENVYNDILMVLGDGIMSWIYLNDVINKSIQNKRFDVFVRGFQHCGSILQNAGGVLRIFYPTGNDLASVKVALNVKQLYQQNHLGAVQYIENNEIHHRYFRLRGLQFELANFEINSMKNFGFSMTKDNEGFIFEPSDNNLKILRSLDFATVSELECSIISEHSVVQHSAAGIWVWENDSVYLLNKK